MKNIYTKVPTSIIPRRPLSGICRGCSYKQQTPGVLAGRARSGNKQVNGFTLIELLKVAYAQHNSSLWYLYYDFTQDKMFCGSAQTKGLALCKSVGKGEEQTCGSNNELSC